MNPCGSLLEIARLHQCIYCSKAIWPWQRYGWFVGRKGTIYWHSKHRRVAR